MTKAVTPPTGHEFEVNLREALEERYLAYALSTIMHRALPDVRDGLKPVHRRVLFAMRQLKLEPGSGFKKSARVVGDVIGRYHPHGDQSVYDALVRLAQDFAVRYPLVDGQGNFGNVDGDNAAAMRYTETRLTEVAALLLDANVDGRFGGTGIAFDWSLVPAPLARSVVLSGGLDAGNVGRAIHALRPWAVDVSSGVEVRRGVKDAARIEEFMRSVRDADARAGG